MSRRLTRGAILVSRLAAAAGILVLLWLVCLLLTVVCAGMLQVAAPTAEEAAPAAPTAPQLGAAAAARPLIAVTGSAVSAPAAAFSDSQTAVDAITAIPLQRWDWEALSSSATGSGGQLPARFGGWLSGIDMFDAAAFGVSGVEAMLMDVQQRMLLELSLTALSGASAAAAAVTGEAALHSISSSIVAGDQHGCIAVGIASAEYNNYLLQRTGAATSAYSATGDWSFECLEFACAASACIEYCGNGNVLAQQAAHSRTQHILLRML